MPRAIDASRRCWSSSFLAIVVSVGRGSSCSVARAARDELCQVIRELVTEIAVLETELYGRLEIAELRSAIVAFALECIGVDRFVGEQRRDAVGELNLAAGPALRLLE